MIIYMTPQFRVEDLAYAAGIIDGEGTIGIYHRKERRTLRTRITVSMCEPEAVTLLHGLFGGALNLQPRPRRARANHRPQYVWCVAALKANRCAELLLPFLRVKKVQAQNIMTLQALNTCIRNATTKQRTHRAGAWGPSLPGRFSIDPKLLKQAEDLYQAQRVLNTRGKVAA